MIDRRLFLRPRPWRLFAGYSAAAEEPGLKFGPAAPFSYDALKARAPRTRRPAVRGAAAALL
jgi:hypothetical protein